MELRDYLRIFSAHWVGIVLLTILGVAVAFGYSSLQPRVYTASTSGYVSASKTGSDTGSSLIGNQLAQEKVTSYVDIGGWRSVAQSALDELGLTASPEQLVARVNVSNPLNTVIIRVSANGSTPEEARDLAEAWLRGMASEIDNIEGDGTPGSAAITLIPGEAAALPTAPSSPNTQLNLALGGLAGLALGIAYALTRNVLDRRVRNPRDIEQETGVSVVGALPLDKQLADARTLLTFDGPGHTQNSVAVTEALRELRTNLQFMDVDNPPKVIIVTSPLPGDGKSTTAANLAVGLAAAGEPVVLIDADLRRPVIADIFDLPVGAGLTDVLAGRVEFLDVAHTPDPAGSLVVLTAGRIPPNPSEVLGSKRMRELLTQLSSTATIIVDSPPTIPVTDAAVLSTAADGVLLVVSAGKTTYDMMHKALENIAKTNGRVLGVVLNKVPRRGSGAAYYGYQYKGAYGAESERIPQSASEPAPQVASEPAPQVTRERPPQVTRERPSPAPVEAPVAPAIRSSAPETSLSRRHRRATADESGASLGEQGGSAR